MTQFMTNVAAWMKERVLWDQKLDRANQQDKEVEPKLKVFQPINSNLKILDGYTESLGDGYWNSWVKTHIVLMTLSHG